MPDVFSKAKRREIMSKIAGKETKPEILVRKYLFSKGFRYRKNPSNLIGKPDIVLPKFRTVILVHGCFWHQHTCKAATLPASNIKFWKSKIQRNANRDRLVKKSLRKSRWNVIVVWQCQIKNRILLERTMGKVIDKIRKRNT